MFGFTAFSEAPLSQATTAVVALAVLGAVTSVGSIDVVTTDAKASVVQTLFLLLFGLLRTRMELKYRLIHLM